MFKDIGSGKPDLVLNGIRNAAWDLATAHYWSSRVTEAVGSGSIWIFCTFDKALREIATNLLTDCDEQYDLEHISSFVSSYWPSESTNRIMSRYGDLNMVTSIGKLKILAGGLTKLPLKKICWPKFLSSKVWPL